MEPTLQILKEYWGYDKFRPLQENIIHAALNGEDVLALLPTGGGKSICFQVPAMLKEGICLVVTPLIALMKDQVLNLNSRGIKAEAVFSGMRQREIDVVLDNCIYGDVKFLYLSPERLETDLFRERVLKMNVNLLAVDEAHCISQWGYDFRPSYLNIAHARELLPQVNILALTASATPKVVEDIQEKLHFRVNNVFKKSFARSNLSYSVRYVEDKERKLFEVLNNVQGSAIVYVNTRKEAKDVAVMLYKKGISTDFYHAGLTHAQRDSKQERWRKNQTRVMVATNAFGMGIDKPDVRLVVHLGLNQDLESYYQEAGRAGRDEKKAYALILYDELNVEELKRRIQLQHPDLNYLKQVYQALANYFKLAIGSGLGQSYDFDIKDFSENYQLHHLEVFYALKKLENEGLITFNESFFNPSHIHIPIDNTELYKFQVANSVFDPLIKALLRLYGGEMFNHFMSISEQQLAKFMEGDEQTVRRYLAKLNDLGIVVYEPQKDQPQIVFTVERQNPENLPVDTKHLKQREEIAIGKMAAVINYAKHVSKCRTVLLLDYFGETKATNCDVCDYCVKKKKENQTDHIDKYHHQIEHLLADKKLLVEELVSQINPRDQDVFLEVIRNMVDRGELKYDDQWRLAKN